MTRRPEHAELAAIRAAYDAVAPAYAEQFLHELEGKPLDRALLGAFAEAVRGTGAVADLGTGCGHVARHLHERGVEVFGVDLSPRTVALAREAHRDRGIEFREGDFFALDLPGGALAGVAFHVGEERLHVDEWLGQRVALDWRFFSMATVAAAAEAAGLAVDARVERAPYAGLEYPTQRGYVLARKRA